MTLVLPSPAFRPGQPPVNVPLGASLVALSSTIASIWTTLSPAASRGTLDRLAFVSARHGEGTTTLACCAAIGLARYAKLNVVLVEGNPYSASLLQKFELSDAPTLYDVVAGRIAPKAALLETDVPRLQLLCLGPPGASGPLTVGRAEWLELMSDVGKNAGYLILDGAPFLDRPQARLLLEPFRRVIVVARAKSSQRADMQKLTEGLRRLGLEPLGAVLNRSS